MNVLAWALQILLALASLAAGALKATRPKEQLRERMAWVDHYSALQVKGIGAVEILGALGLVLPAATSTAVVLTPLAAVGLALVMTGAVITHVRIKEPLAASVPAIVLGVLAVVVAVLRFGPASLS